MPRLEHNTIIPSDDEDAAITAAASSDPDARPLTDLEWETVRPRARIGRPPSVEPKVSTTIELSPEVLAHFGAGGPGWQTRIDEVLLEYVAKQAAPVACGDEG